MGSALRTDLRQRDLCQLAAEASRQETAAVNELVARCGPKVAAYLDRRRAAEPEALANLVMAEFVRSLPRLSFAVDGQLWSYLYRLATNRLIDERRRQRPEYSTDRPELIAGADHDLSGLDDQVVDEIWVSELVSSLTDDQRLVIELRFGEDLSLQETANRTGKSVSAVKALQHRALAALAAIAAATAAVAIALFLLGPFGSSTEVRSVDPVQPVPETPEIDGAEDGELGLDRSDRRPTESIEVDDISGTPTAGAGLEPGPADVPEPDSAAVPAEPLGPVTAQPDVHLLPWVDPEARFVDLDVLANDQVDHSTATIEIIDQPAAGFAEVLADAGVVRFHRGAPGQDSFSYRACDRQGCGSATVSVTSGWYEDVCAVLLEAHRGGAPLDTDQLGLDVSTDLLLAAIVGTEGDDELIGTPETDVIFGLGGDDTIDGGGGADILCGGDGADQLAGGAGDDLLSGGPGDDELSGDLGRNTFFGGPGRDGIAGSEEADVIFGGPGDDLIGGLGGGDLIFGEDGHDYVEAGSGDNVFFGGAGDDYVSALDGDDLLVGGLGRDRLGARFGDDRLFGGPDDDALLVATGSAAVLDGGDGQDRCYSGSTQVDCWPRPATTEGD